MKVKSWPKPPLLVQGVPEIPDEFKIFGIEYVVEDLKILPKDIPNERFNKERVIGLVKDSYSEYLKILNGFKGDVEEINRIHLKINEELNKCKEEEVAFEIQRLKNEKNRSINRMIEELENEMNRGFQ